MSDLIKKAEVIFKDSEDSLSRKPQTVEVEQAPQPVVQRQKHRGESKPMYHKVRKGETLSSIAKKNGTTVKKLKKLNNLRSDKIKHGTRLKVR
jgi:membrane-bound lytic murein transglycosylase D